MEGYIAIALFVVVMQLVFSVFQLRYYDRFIKDLVEKYNIEGYSLDSETVKKFLKTVIVVIVTDEENVIIEAHQYEGLTVFARFQSISGLISRTMNENLYHELEENQENLTNVALLKIMERKN